MADLSRIKPTTRAAVPLPPPPRLSEMVAGKVVLKTEIEKMDEQLKRWWESVQIRLSGS